MKKYMVGRVPVDTGQVIIVDPVNANKFTRDDYEDASRVTLKEDVPAGETFTKGEGRTPLGVACATPGDGKYPVYLYTDDEGKPVSIVIDLE